MNKPRFKIHWTEYGILLEPINISACWMKVCYHFKYMAYSYFDRNIQKYILIEVGKDLKDKK